MKYNPRSYLELEGQAVNRSIRETILNKGTNEFALFNNGITMISDETHINERIGQKNKAQLSIKNPQIINGGQTTFTLSRIYEEEIQNDVERVFKDKEVLLKIITLVDVNGEVENKKHKLQLIDEISTATNQQTPVIIADKFSNELTQVKLQRLLFDRYGILFERKRGEFGDGILKGYIQRDQILERNLFYRIYFGCNGRINKAVEKKIFMHQALEEEPLNDLGKLDNFYFGFKCLKKISTSSNPQKTKHKFIYGQLYALTKMCKPDNIDGFDSAIQNGLKSFKISWDSFVDRKSKTATGRFVRTYIDKETRQPRQTFNTVLWYRSEEFEKDVMEHFK